EDHGLQDELRARYSGLRRYLPAFLELPFQAERGSERLLAAIELARELNRERARNLRACGGFAQEPDRPGQCHRSAACERILVGPARKSAHRARPHCKDHFRSALSFRSGASLPSPIAVESR